MKANKLIERILVGVDSEGLGSNAAVRGWTLAQALGAKLDFVHAVDVPPPLWPGVSEEQLATWHASALAHSREGALAKLTAALADAGIDAQADEFLSVYPGHAAKVLLRRVEDMHADLVIIGHHSRRALVDFGSTARTFLARTEVPVWTQADTPTPIERILVPVDLSEHSRTALVYAHSLALELGAALRVFHCYAPPVYTHAFVAEPIPGFTDSLGRERSALKSELDRWMREFDWQTVPVESKFVEELSTERAIVDAADADDLIVMGTHGHTGLARFVLGSVAYGVLKGARKPVLLVPSPSRSWQLDTGRESMHLAAVD